MDRLLGTCLAKPDQTIEEHTNDLLECLETLIDYGYLTDERVQRIVRLAILAHDKGKMSPRFQERLLSKESFQSDKEVGHNILSYFLMEQTDDPDEEYISYAVINHHYFVRNNNTIVTEKRELVRSNLQEIFTKAGKQFDNNQFERRRRHLDRISKKIRIERENGNPFAAKIIGLLNKCDYAASAHVPIEYPPNFLENKLSLLMEEWKRNKPEHNWNEMQVFCRENQGENLCIVAPTGMGKTEAALWWIGDNKGFFVLPLKTAINAIYRRVANQIIHQEKIESRVALLHSDGINVYQEMQDHVPDVLMYHQESKKFSFPLTITTPDQIFDFAFQANGYEHKYAIMSYSRIVIDEIQAYSSDLLATLIYGIHMILKIGGKVSIFTATIPPFIYDLLQIREKGGESAYSFQYQEFDNPMIRHHVCVQEKELTADDIIEHYQNSRTNQNPTKYLVVCNTVKKAQKIFKALQKKGFTNCYLLHSKFTKMDRSGKEEAIIQAGKTFSDEDPTQLLRLDEIWVSTQIVEASLDIDFDVLFTELSDLNALFQRFGRINRKGFKPTDEPNCFVFTAIDDYLLRKSGDTTDHGFIDEGVYELSKEAITLHRDGLISERQKQDLIQSFLTTERLIEKGSRFLNEYWTNYMYLDQTYVGELDENVVRKRFRNIISYDVIPVDIERGNPFLPAIEESYARLKEIEDLLGSSKVSASDRPALRVESHEIMKRIMQYTVPVGRYDLGKGNRHTLPTLRLNRYREIYLLNCHYDSELGFRRLDSNDVLSAKDTEDTEMDNFC